MLCRTRREEMLVQAGASHSIVKASASAEQEAAADEERQSGGEMWEVAEPLGGAAAGGLDVMSFLHAPAVHMHIDFWGIVFNTCCVCQHAGHCQRICCSMAKACSAVLNTAGDYRLYIEDAWGNFCRPFRFVG